MRKPPFPMPLVDLALAKALDHLAVAQTAARLCDEDLASEIAAATSALRALRGKTTSLGDALEKRRVLMQNWADFCGRSVTSAEIMPLHARA